MPSAAEAEARSRELLGEQLEDPLAAIRERSGVIAEAMEQIGELRRRETRIRAEENELRSDAAERIAALEPEVEDLGGSGETRGQGPRGP